MNSIWMKDYKEFQTKTLQNNEACDVLVIGGGIAGLMSAYFLMKNNINFKLVEANKLACGVSSKTTAQLSVAHDTKYQEIKKKHGIKKAQEYYSSQCDGLNLLFDIIKNENIKCDLEIQNTIVYSNDKDNGLTELNKEIETLKEIRANIKASKGNGLVKYKKGIVYPNQGIFNPIKYMSGIIKLLLKPNCDLYENTKVTKIKKVNKKYEVTINDEKVITANKIIMACHYPPMTPFNFYFVKMYQSMSYAISFKSKLQINDNYVSIDEPYVYLRKYNNTTLIMGGCDHYTGIDMDFNNCYEKLINKIYEFDKDAKILNKWSTEDCMPIDSLPYADNISFHKNLYLITGFQKWGFTNAHIAAFNVVNKIMGKKKKTLYNTFRFSLFRDLKSTGRIILHSIDGLFLSKIGIKKYELKNIPVDSGKVMKYYGKNVLVYRESKDKYIILKNKCTHMGCSLIWNDVEKTWQSKCHGSIFDKYGHVLEGPATKDLERLL